MRRFVRPAIALALVMTYGVSGYMLLEGWSFLDALYMTVVTLTTVGFREVHPLDGSGKLFTITLMIMGVSLLLLTITLVAAWVSEGNLAERRRRRRMQQRIDRLKDHFIVCAYGRVGRSVTREFKQEDVPFLVIDHDQGLEQRMIDDGVAYLIGEPAEEEVLRRAGIERARGLICAVDSDATNVFIAMTARSLSDRLFIVARAASSDSIPRLERAGANRVISPYATSGQHMAMMALRPSVRGYLEMTRDGGGTALRLEEVRVGKGSTLAGKTVRDVSGGASLLAVRHEDGRVSPHPHEDMRIREGDLLIMLGDQEVLRPVEER